jgi:hypothetical protein
MVAASSDNTADNIMTQERLLLVGLDDAEYQDILPRLQGMPVIHHPTVPNYTLDEGILWIESSKGPGKYYPVDRVVFHGIFEDDFNFINALAIWRGRCLPDALGLLTCRLRLPCLAHSLEVTRFGKMRRSFLHKGGIQAKRESVAKWGNWHCGENKSRFVGDFKASEATVVEPFIHGKAVRVVLMGERYWQIQLEGDDWLKSIHHDDARFMPVDEELLEDTRSLSRALRLEMLGVDYMVGDDGEKHLLEVNHIPNVTRFPEVREAFLSFASSWALGEK